MIGFLNLDLKIECWHALNIGANVEYMASSRTQMLIRIININKPQIVSKMPDTAICYIHG